MSAMRRAIGLALAAMAALAAHTGAASAAEVQTIGYWSDPCLACEPFIENEKPLLAVAPNGAAVAVWTDAPGFRVAVRPARGAWQPAEPLGVGEPDPAKPVVAINPRDRAMIFWVSASGDAAQSHMRSASIDIGHGGWSAPQTIPGPTAAPEGLALDSAGDAVAVWRHFFLGNEDGGIILASYRRAGARSWPPPVALAGGPPSREHHYEGLAQRPSVAVDERGDATVVWEETRLLRETPGGAALKALTLVLSRTLTAGARRWSGSVVVQRGEGRYPKVAVDSHGDTAAVWSLESRRGVSLRAAARPHGSPGWTAPVTVAQDDGHGFGEARLAVDDRGDAFLGYETYAESRNLPLSVASGSARSGHWHAPLLLGRGQELDLGVNGRGDTAVTWSVVDEAVSGLEAPTRIELAVERAGRPWGVATPLSSGSAVFDYPRVGLDAAGHATVTWMARGGRVESVGTP
jgi:hypothetical protein